MRPIGICDNFFALGGHSLLAVRLTGRIEEVWGKKIPATTLLTSATIEQLARIIAPDEAQTTAETTHTRKEAGRRTFLSGLMVSLKGKKKMSSQGTERYPLS